MASVDKINTLITEIKLPESERNIYDAVEGLRTNKAKMRTISLYKRAANVLVRNAEGNEVQQVNDDGLKAEEVLKVLESISRGIRESRTGARSRRSRSRSRSRSPPRYYNNRPNGGGKTRKRIRKHKTSKHKTRKHKSHKKRH